MELQCQIWDVILKTNKQTKTPVTRITSRSLQFLLGTCISFFLWIPNAVYICFPISPLTLKYKLIHIYFPTKPWVLQIRDRFLFIFASQWLWYSEHLKLDEKLSWMLLVDLGLTLRFSSHQPVQKLRHQPTRLHALASYIHPALFGSLTWFQIVYTGPDLALTALGHSFWHFPTDYTHPNHRSCVSRKNIRHSELGNTCGNNSNLVSL